MIEIWIDELTECLVERRTGLKRETEFGQVVITEEIQRRLKKQGWLFEWDKAIGITEALRIKGDSEIQGLISYSIKEGYVEVNLVESNPKNIGKNGCYVGVGGHLFAIACYRSALSNGDGVVAMTVKTSVINHYREKLGAISYGRKERMMIDGEASQALMEKYLKRWYTTDVQEGEYAREFI